MKELRDEILRVLQSATGSGSTRMEVSREALYFLQEQYNIHFVEPEDTQVTLIKRN